jgi:hypothetical protein
VDFHRIRMYGFADIVRSVRFGGAFIGKRCEGAGQKMRSVLELQGLGG